VTHEAATLAATALQRINVAFAERSPPTALSDSLQLSDSEYDEVMAFEGLGWQDVTFDQIWQMPDVVFWFSPAAFGYYLPGILAAGLREARFDTDAYDAIIGMLDRSPEPDYWDDFFAPRWSLLSVDEIDAVVAWLEWLQAVQPDEVYSGTYRRVRDTLALLRMMAEDRVRPS